jgi:hypothetical protein
MTKPNVEGFVPVNVETPEPAHTRITARGVLTECISVLKTEGGLMVIACGACMLPAAVLNYYWMRRLSTLETLGPFDTSVDDVALLPFWAAALGAGVLLAAGVLSRHDVGFAESIAGALRRLVPLVVAVAMIRFAVVVGLLLLVVPGVLLGIRLGLTAPVLMIERLGPLQALKRSWNLTRDHQLTVFCAFIPVWLLSLGAMVGAVVPLQDTMDIQAQNPLQDLTPFTGALTCTYSWFSVTISSVLFAALESVLYVQLRASTVEQRIEQPRFAANAAHDTSKASTSL